MNLILSIVFGIFLVLLLTPVNQILPNHDFKRMLKTMDEIVVVEKEINRSKGPLDKISLYGTKLLNITKYKLPFKKQLSLEKELLRAGLNKRFTPNSFMGLKVGLVMVGVFYAFSTHNLMESYAYKLICLLMPVICFYWPNIWIKNITSIRLAKIQKEMPFVLSSIAVLVESGQSLNQSIIEVTRMKSGILVDEFKVSMLEIDLGFSRVQAFERMMDRIHSKDLSVFLSALIQSIEKGSSGVSELLNKQSEELWKQRTEKAKELAEKASIKLFLPLLLLVLPSMLIFVMAPAIISLIAVL